MRDIREETGRPPILYVVLWPQLQETRKVRLFLVVQKINQLIVSTIKSDRGTEGKTHRYRNAEDSTRRNSHDERGTYLTCTPMLEHPRTRESIHVTYSFPK